MLLCDVTMQEGSNWTVTMGLFNWKLREEGYWAWCLQGSLCVDGFCRDGD